MFDGVLQLARLVLQNMLSNHNLSIRIEGSKVIAIVLSFFIQIMQDGLVQDDKHESAGRFLFESVTMQELCRYFNEIMKAPIQICRDFFGIRV